MAGFQGMDTVQVDEFGTQLDRGMDTLSDTADTLRALIASTVGTGWIGPDAEEFQDEFEQRCTPVVVSALDRMRGFLDEISGHVEEQDIASEASAVGGIDPTALTNSLSGFFGNVFTWVGDATGDSWSFGEWGAKILENLNPFSGPGGAITIRSAMHALGELGGETFPKWFPVLGDIYTGGFAALERWHQDSGRTDLDIGQKIGRALFDGAMTGGGSFLGRVSMMGVGAAVGAALGVETGPGAFLTGAAGAVVLGFVGSLGGAAVLGGLADSILD